MKHIKKFETLNSINGFITPKPFIGSIHQENMMLQTKYSVKCNIENNKIETATYITGIWDPESTNNTSKVIISGEVELNGKTDCYSITFESDAHLTINTGARLRVWEGGITNNDCDTVNYLTISCDGTIKTDLLYNAFGEFLIHPNVTVNTHPKATIIFPLLIGKDQNNNYTWEHFTFLSSSMSNFTRNPQISILIFTWDYTQQDWESISSLSQIMANIPYFFTTKQQEPSVIMFSCDGNLLGNDNLIYTANSEGYNLFGISHTAKIDIQKFITYFPANLDKKITCRSAHGSPVVEKTSGPLTPSANFIIRLATGSYAQINAPYKECIWDYSFEEESTPTRSGAKGGNSNLEIEKLDSKLFENPDNVNDIKNNNTK